MGRSKRFTGMPGARSITCSDATSTDFFSLIAGSYLSDSDCPQFRVQKNRSRPKYKTGDAKGQYANSDYYQMLAYCTALEVPRAWLVYARGGSGRVRRIVNTGISVIEYSLLDLISDPRALLARIDTLARGAWRTIERT